MKVLCDRCHRPGVYFYNLFSDESPISRCAAHKPTYTALTEQGWDQCRLTEEEYVIRQVMES